MLAGPLLLSEISGISYVLFVQPKNTWVSFSGLSALSSELPLAPFLFLYLTVLLW